MRNHLEEVSNNQHKQQQIEKVKSERHKKSKKIKKIADRPKIDWAVFSKLEVWNKVKWG